MHFSRPQPINLILQSICSEITNILYKSTDPAELKYMWQQWYDKAGKPTRASFDQYVKLNREAAQLNSKLMINLFMKLVKLRSLCSDFTSGAEVWLSEYEDNTFEQQLENIFDQIRPLYEQLHAYVRHKLRLQYGNHIVDEDGPIPMHLVGNMWAQDWENVSTISSTVNKLKSKCNKNKYYR